MIIYNENRTIPLHYTFHQFSRKLLKINVTTVTNVTRSATPSSCFPENSWKSVWQLWQMWQKWHVPPHLPPVFQKTPENQCDKCDKCDTIHHTFPTFSRKLLKISVTTVTNVTISGAPKPIFHPFVVEITVPIMTITTRVSEWYR